MFRNSPALPQRDTCQENGREMFAQVQAEKADEPQNDGDGDRGEKELRVV